MTFLDEIRRRNVHRVAIAYLAGTWLLIQVVETLFPLFGLSEVAARAVVIVLAVGFVPVLVLSWVFEWTPQGVVRDGDVSAETPRTPTKYLDRAITIMLVLAVAYFAVDKFVIDPARDAAQIEAATERALATARVESYGDKSIAVLPFVNMSSDPEQEYFSDGISEELLNLLAKIPELRVISRSTAFTFKGKDIAVPDAAKKMKVAHILEGSVRKAGNQVRITVQLIDARTDTHLWSQTYDRTLDDIFIIQDEISAQVVSELKLQLLDGPPTAEEIDPDAYELYLRARQVVHENHEDQYDEAEQNLNRVLEVEPEFVPVIWELTRLAARKGGLDNERVRELIARMVEISPDSSYANGWLAHIALYSEGDYQKAAHYFERAVAFDNDWNSDFQLGQGAKFLYRMGRIEEAAEISRFLLSRDPACSRCIDTMVVAMRAAGRHLEAAKVLETTLDWYAPSPQIYWSLGVAWLVAGEPETALRYFSKIETGGPGYDGLDWLGRLLALHSLGRHDEFEDEFARYREAEQNRPEGLNPEGIARVYAWSGQNDQAFAWLDKMVEQQGPESVLDVKTDLYAKLKPDPRWQEFLEKHGATDEDLSHIVFNPKLPAAVRSALEAGSATR